MSDFPGDFEWTEADQQTLDQLWSETPINPERTSGGGEVPDGTYVCSLDKCQWVFSKNGYPMIKWVFKVLAPNHVGRLIFRNDLINGTTAGRLKRDFVRIGIDEEYVNDQNFVKQAMEQHIGVIVEIRVWTKKGDKTDFRNIYINKVVDTFDAVASVM